MAAAALEPAWCFADSPRRQSAARTSATETPRDTSPGTAPAVSVSKCRSLDVLSVDLQHNRQPDVGIGIRVQIHATCYAPAQEYYGEYIGHGLTKTAFLLRRSTRDQTISVDATEHAPDYDGKVFKLSKNRDVEPEVFRQAYTLEVTTSILLEANAIDTDTTRNYHCWITDRCIPLNQLCDHHNINKINCSIGAYYCLLRAAVGNLYVSDCGFQNLGLVVNENATEHSIVVIDAGHNRITTSAWSKADVNTKVMKRFFKHCEEYGAAIPEIQRHWQQCHELHEPLQRAKTEWERIRASITEQPRQSEDIAAALRQREQEIVTTAKDSSIYQIIKAVGEAVAGVVWSDDCITQCYRACASVCFNLIQEDKTEIDSLYSRMTTGATVGENPIAERVRFWVQLDEFRRQQYGSDVISKEEADGLLHRFRMRVLWYELDSEQKKTNASTQNSILYAILRKRAGYKHAATAIMQYGLPQLMYQDGSDDLELHMQNLAEFASAMNRWLQLFSASMRWLRLSEGYQKQQVASSRALHNRYSRR